MKVLVLGLVVVFGAVLFSQKSDEPLSEELSEWLSSGTFQRVLGHDVFTVDQSGSGEETLVVVHGFPTSCYEWKVASSHFLSSFGRVVLFDHVGFGFSSKPTTIEYSIQLHADVLQELLAAKGVSKAHFLCHDMGDSVCLELLGRVRLANSSLVSSMTLLNGGMRIKLINFRITQTLLRVPYLNSLLHHLTREWVFKRQVSSLFGRPDAISGEHVHDWFTQMGFNGGRKLMPSLIKYLDDRARHEDRWLQNARMWPKKDENLFMIWAMNDAVAPVAIFDEVKRMIGLSDSQVDQIDGLGHWLMAENPALFADRFLKLTRRTRLSRIAETF